MKLKEMMLACISNPVEIEGQYPRFAQKKELGLNVCSGLGKINLEREELCDEASRSLVNLVIQAIDNKNFDLGILQKMQQAFSIASKQKQRKAFISFLDKELNQEQLHKLSQAIMENANELMPDDDPNFVCRTSNNKVFQEILLLEAKGNNFSVEVDRKGTLKINFPSKLLELYKLLVDNFYLKNFEKEELQKKLYHELFPDCQIPFEELIKKEELQKKLYHELFPDCQIPFEELIEEVSFFENFMQCLKEFYIKNSLAQSIMFLLVSEYIRESGVSEELLELEVFKKLFEEKMSLYGTSDDFKLSVVQHVLNDKNGVYISNLTSSNILELVTHTQPDCEIVSIEILGESKSPV
ncbi:hypothetical protein A1C_02710 [Rickettsia akari str. Hartford]|uniref:Uncharacterized protein n=1 Tax=Rickettsia akari (strain Hartford) TaxID=293614 RepID=A8GN62_RICAH|nr:DUF5410 family protein [Rickettsia akari]ABV74837.1 hypothetical protein A1C_02710 [Rickettsia akari str. Hartford]